jgi:hypothetical protein
MSKQAASAAWLTLVCVAIHPTAARADSGITFFKVADTETAIPGGERSFRSLAAPSLAGGDVAFNGGGDPFEPCAAEGLYLYRDGQLQAVANNCTPIPDCPGGLNFVGFSQPALGHAKVTFSGAAAYGGYYCRGIYTWAPNTGFIVNADPSTPDPGGYGRLSDFFTVSRDGDALGFTAWTSMCTHGIYSANDTGEIALVANYDTPIPGGHGTFTAFEFNVTVGDEIVAFTGGTWDSEQWGVYTSQEGVTKIADQNTPIPDGSGAFTTFGDRPSTDGGCVVFWGAQIEHDPYQVVQEGIYTNLGGQLRVVADLNTPIPRGVGNFTRFTSFYGPSLDHGRVAFRGEGSGGQVGIYCELNGRLIRVVDLSNATLEPDKTLTGLFIDEQCLDGNRLGFVAGFSTETPGEHFYAIYVATLPSTPRYVVPAGVSTPVPAQP